MVGPSLHVIISLVCRLSVYMNVLAMIMIMMNDYHYECAAAVQVAASRGDASIARVLVEATADVGGEDGDSNTPLHLAASAEVVSLLLHAGAGRCMTRLNKCQRTPEREMAARSWSWVPANSEREEPMREFLAWPRFIGALQRLAWCRAVLRHDVCCGVTRESDSDSAVQCDGEGRRPRRRAQVFLSLDLAEMVVEMVAPADGCAKTLATRSGRIGRAANNSVVFKDAQERIEELWAARGSKLSAQVEAELFSTGPRQDNRLGNCDETSGEDDADVIAKCVMCHIKTSRWCAGCAEGSHTKLFSGLALPTIGESLETVQNAHFRTFLTRSSNDGLKFLSAPAVCDLGTGGDPSDPSDRTRHTTLRYCEGSVFTQSRTQNNVVAQDAAPPARPWWTKLS